MRRRKNYSLYVFVMHVAENLALVKCNSLQNFVVIYLQKSEDCYKLDHKNILATFYQILNSLLCLSRDYPEIR